MAAAVNCPNIDVNNEMCPCPIDSCDNHGICCLCAENHVTNGGQTFCMRGTDRPAETMSLQGVDSGKCERNAANLENCTCSYTSCGNHATCCDCVRNHWGNATYPTPSCMK